MFWGADIFNIDISSWDISNVTNISSMFRGALAFNKDISSWNTANVTDISAIFSYTTNFNYDLTNWDMSNVNDMSYAFQFAESFDQDLGSWDITAVTDMTEMLSDCGMSEENYDETLIGWSGQNVQQNVSLGALNLFYCLGEDARNLLIDVQNWAITGDDIDCSILPIELLYFNAEQNESKHVDINWSTATEINNEYFTIERSKDGVQFEQLEEVPGAGYSTQMTTYTSKDTNPFNGISYYRLKQTDFEGKISYSDIKVVNIVIDQHFTIYPNPIRDVLHVVGDGNYNGKTNISIFDAIGNLKYSKQLMMNDDKRFLDIYEVSEFLSGNYFLVIQNGFQTQTFNLIKVHE
jgi:surface protein